LSEVGAALTQPRTGLDEVLQTNPESPGFSRGECQFSDDVERRFREVAMKLYGCRKGFLSVASEKAISAWFSQVSEVLDIAESIDDPVEAICGVT